MTAEPARVLPVEYRSRPVDEDVVDIVEDLFQIAIRPYLEVGSTVQIACPRIPGDALKSIQQFFHLFALRSIDPNHINGMDVSTTARVGDLYHKNGTRVLFRQRAGNEFSRRIG